MLYNCSNFRLIAFPLDKMPVILMKNKLHLFIVNDRVALIINNEECWRLTHKTISLQTWLQETICIWRCKGVKLRINTFVCICKFLFSWGIFSSIISLFISSAAPFKTNHLVVDSSLSDSMLSLFSAHNFV